MFAFASSAKARCPPNAPMARAPSGGLRNPSARRIDEIRNVEKKTRMDTFVRRSLLIMR